MSTWVIVLIVIGVIILLAIIVGTCVKARSSGIGFFEALGEGFSDAFDGLSDCGGGDGDWGGGGGDD